MYSSARSLIVVVIAGAVCSCVAARTEVRERSEVPVEATWNLQDLYPSDQAWAEAKARLAGQLDKVLEFKGKLAQSPSELLACLEFNSDLSKELSRLHSYAAMKVDEDTRNSKYLAMRQETEQLATDYGSKASFIEPEIAAMDKGEIDQFLAAEPGLKVYRMYLTTSSGPRLTLFRKRKRRSWPRQA